MRPLFRISSDESGTIKKIEFLYRDGPAEDVTESVYAAGFSIDGDDVLTVTIRANVVTGETIKETK